VSSAPENTPGERPAPQTVRTLTPKKTADERAALLRLLQLEADMRRIPTERELIYHLANESRAVLGFRQAFVFRLGRRWKLEAVSSVAGFDRNAPINRQMVSYIASLPTGEDPVRLDLEDKEAPPALRTHTFRHGIWIPLTARNGRVFAGALVLRERPWRDDQLPLSDRLSGAYAHSWQALAGKAVERRGLPPARVILPVLMLALFLAGFIPAPLTVLAPAEVNGQQRSAVTASLDGVIEEVLVDPNDEVAENIVLARYDSTELRNALAISDKRVVVAQSELVRLQNASFGDREAGRDVKIAEAELELALAERALARQRLSRVDIVAGTSGIAVFEDARDLTGRPVAMGEKLMEVVNPTQKEFTIRLPVDDSIALAEGAKVRVFLDSRPLSPITGKLVRSSYRASSHEDGSFAYTLVARASPEDMKGVRIGAHGTAQVYGAIHSLHFIVFRRPLSWLRQTIGF